MTNESNASYNELEQNLAIQRNRAYIQDPKTRQALFEKFSPIFFFHKEEQSFPLHPDDFIRNVIEVKYDEYTHIQERQGRELSEIEKQELEAINRYFWKDGKFNPDYKHYQDQELFKLVVNGKDDKNKIYTDSKFFVFDEKKYGYKVGEKIDIVGVAPEGHKNYSKDKPHAPLNASIIPTEQGFYIQYEYVYALNDAIKGSRLLRELLPSNVAQKASDFGFHYGDCEGVGMYIKVDDNGKASLDAMQTFAHGTKGARKVDLKDCTFNNAKPCVFVGLGGHPSYADNFVGRNKYLDLVGDAYKIIPKTFYDVSPDIIDLANGITPKDQASAALQKVANELPSACSTFDRIADSNSLSWSGPKNAQDIKYQSAKWNQYNPVLLVTKIWNKIKSIAQSLLGVKKDDEKIPLVFDIKSYLESDQSQKSKIVKEKTLSKTKSWVATLESRDIPNGQGQSL